jgi:hypothetical protein
MKKITKATFKSFIKKNEGKLFVQNIAHFSSHSDMVEYLPSDERTFKKLEKITISDMDYRIAERRGTTREWLENYTFNSENTLGYEGIYLVNHSRDSFRDYEDDQFIGINVYNCCGNFTVAIQKGI